MASNVGSDPDAPGWHAVLRRTGSCPQSAGGVDLRACRAATASSQGERPADRDRRRENAFCSPSRTCIRASWPSMPSSTARSASRRRFRMGPCPMAILALDGLQQRRQRRLHHGAGMAAGRGARPRRRRCCRHSRHHSEHGPQSRIRDLRPPRNPQAERPHRVGPGTRSGCVA